MCGFKPRQIGLRPGVDETGTDDPRIVQRKDTSSSWRGGGCYLGFQTTVSQVEGAEHDRGRKTWSNAGTANAHRDIAVGGRVIEAGTLELWRAASTPDSSTARRTGNIQRETVCKVRLEICAQAGTMTTKPWNCKRACLAPKSRATAPTLPWLAQIQGVLPRAVGGCFCELG